MLLAIQILCIAVLLIALYFVRRHTRRTLLRRAGATGKEGYQARMSARTEMRAFDTMTTVTRTVDLHAARRDRALRRGRSRSRRRAA